MTSLESSSTAGSRGDLLRSGVACGLLAGLVFGLIDGLIAWRIGPSMSALQLLGCLAGAVLVYAGLFGLAGAALGLLAGPILRGRAEATRLVWLLGLLLAAGIFCEVYWWTRPYVYYGVPADDPRRLAAAAAMAAGSLGSGLLLGRLACLLPVGAFRAAHAALVLAAIGGCATLYGAWRAESASDRGALNERNEELPNVLLFVVDALREDVLEPYGHPRVKTPNAVRLAERGVLFENMFVQAPFTWTSFGSFLTGKYPRRHGLVLMDPSVRMRLAENVTLALHLKQAQLEGGDRLQDGDFAGATFMTGTLSQGSGLMHGFDFYFEAMAGHDLVSLDSRWSVYRSNLLVSLIKNKLTQRFDNSLVTTTAVDWLRNNSGKRFVGMVHLYSTHTPYDPEPEFREQYCDPAYDGPVTAFYAEHRVAIESGEYVPTPADIEQIRNLYLAGVAQADRDVGLVLAELERQGVLDDTMVILTSDHGEELHEHGLWEHNWMYQTNLRIPLIVAWPNGIAGGRREDALVESIDLFPTVCEMMGLELPPDEDAYRRLDGKSLMPLLREEVEAIKEYSFAENGDYVSIQSLEWKLIVPAEVLSEDNGWARAKAGELKRPVRLFDLRVDPDETRNVFQEEPDAAQRMLDALRDWDKTMPIPRVDIQRSHRDLESEAMMEALGYAGGGTGDTSVLQDGAADGAETPEEAGAEDPEKR